MAMLVDAADYFAAVRHAIAHAQHSVFILSWDFDSRIHLVPGGAKDGFPQPLGEFLNAIASSRPELRVYVLNWDYAVLYALEREWLPASKFDPASHPQVMFRMDKQHPLGGSHHQKVVVVDDALAFVGGLDLTRCRWDTSDHVCDDPLRRDLDGKPYAPFHDVQAMADGDCARALGELVRQRWARAYPDVEMPPLRTQSDADLWPAVTPDVCDVDVAISRTEPAFGDAEAVNEIRQLHLDAIASAQSYLFFENQYFTSGLLANAIAQRLAEEYGPEVLVVSPRTQSGWLEQATMGVLRARVQQRLKEADANDCYRMMCPHIPGLDDQCLNVHSKVFTVDDALLTIGSANLSSRSMALDTECNLSIEANGDARLQAAIAAMRHRLLAEHLATTPQHVAQEMARCSSLLQAVDRLSTQERRLTLMDPVVQPELDSLIPKQAWFDPEKPIAPDVLVKKLVPKEVHRPAPRRLLGLGMLAFALALLAVAWRWTPLNEWLNLDSLVAFARSLEHLPLTPVAVVVCYVIAGLVMVPVTLLIAVTGIVFGPLEGSVYALGGSVLSAAVSFGVGHWLGRDAVARMLGPRMNRLTKRIARQGILAMIVIRMLPIAPFTVVNVVAGISPIRLRDYLIGTALGMLPGIVITITFVHHLAEAVRRPSVGTVSILIAVGVLLLTLAVGLQKLLRAKQDSAA